MSSAKFDIDNLGKLTPNSAGAITINYTTAGGKATITAFTPTSYIGPLEIPSTLGGVAVETIGENVFYGFTGFTSVTFAAGSQLKTIGARAFRDATSLTSIIIPASVTFIGDGAFRNTRLTSFVIPALVTVIDPYAFYDCINLTSITFASNSTITTIGIDAFHTCTGLTSITIPSSVTTIGQFAFFACTKLTSIVIPASVISIGVGAFKDCTILATATFLGNVPNLEIEVFNNISTGAKAYYISNTAGRNLAQYFAGGVTQMVFTYTVLSGYATITGFTSKTYAGPLIIPSILGGAPVTYIGVNAFKDYTGLTSITIPASVTYIYAGAFINCTSLETVTFAPISQLVIIGISAFESCTSLKSIIIPSSVIYIGNNAFFACIRLTSIIIPASVTSIGNGAFENATSLTTVTFASGSQLTFIDNHTFQNATSLTSIVIPDSVTFIEEAVFLNSGLITMYVSTKNKLGLTPSAAMPLYGKTFTIMFAPQPFATLPICFLAGSIVTTDQEDTAIEKLRPNFHTILGKKIVSIMTSHPAQKLMYKGKIVSASDLVEGYQEPTPDLFHDKRHDWLHYLYLVRLRDSRTGRR